jgi:tetratricopeptide (TPR) repeat protein
MPLMSQLKRLAFASLILVRATASAQSVTEQIALGDSAHAALQPAAALVHYEAAIAADSTSADALGKASRTVVDIGEQEADDAKRKALFRKGVDYARRAVAAAPNDAEGHFHLARALGRLALSVGVRERVRFANEIHDQGQEALRLDPDHPGALHVLGVWNAEVMRLSGVERFFARNLLGGRRFGEASWDKAIMYMEKAVEVDPERLTHQLDLARIYADRKQNDKARALFERVIAGRVSDFNDPVYKREAEAALKKLK